MLVWQLWRRKARRKMKPKCCEMLGEGRTARASWGWLHGQSHSQSHRAGVQHTECWTEPMKHSWLVRQTSLTSHGSRRHQRTSWEAAHRSLHGGHPTKCQTRSSRGATGPSEQRKFGLISQTSLSSFPDWKWPPNMALQTNDLCFSQSFSVGLVYKNIFCQLYLSVSQL